MHLIGMAGPQDQNRQAKVGTSVEETLSTAFSRFPEFVAIAGSSLYAAVVAVGYASEGPEYKIHFDSEHPVRSAQRLVVGVGVRFVAAVVGKIQTLLDFLFEASAEVGDWLLNRSSSKLQERLRSRFI